jgi:hypothetical protein
MDKKKLLEKILKDEPKGIRKKFLTDPKKTIEEISGKSLGDWRVEIHRIPKKTIVFNLPEKLPPPEKMDDKILEEIAGGKFTHLCTKYHCGPLKTLGPFKPCHE